MECSQQIEQQVWDLRELIETKKMHLSTYRFTMLVGRLTSGTGHILQEHVEHTKDLVTKHIRPWRPVQNLDSFIAGIVSIPGGAIFALCLIEVSET